MRKTEEEQGSHTLRCILYVLLGGALALGGCLFCLLLCSVGVAQGLFKESIMPQLTVACCVVGAMVGGWKSVSLCHRKTLLVGLGVGCVLFLLMLTIGALFFDSMTPEAGGLALLCGCLCGGGLAGLLGSKLRKKRRK